MRKRPWIGLAAALGVALLHHNRDSFERVRANVRAFDLPTAGRTTPSLVASLLGGLYECVGDEVATSLPTGTVLEVGSGPGRLAVLLTQRAPDLSVTGVDISPEMVERATRRAAGAGLGERARFKVGNVGALPFLKAASTERSAPSPCTTGRIRFGGYPRYIGSEDPAGRPSSTTSRTGCWRPAHGESRLDRLAAASPFGGGAVEVVRWPASLPAFVLLRLR
jgi:hypothetical protein